jgi:hypothetical protein
MNAIVLGTNKNLHRKMVVSFKQTNKEEDGVSRLNYGVKALNPTKQSTVRKLDSS